MCRLDLAEFEANHDNYLETYMQRFSIARPGLVASFLVGVATLVGAQQVDQYPNKPIRIIVPTPPGGGIDNGARIVAEKLREAWGQPVIIENRPGANSVIGFSAVAKAPADGYTLLFTSNAYVVVPLASSKLPYDPKDLVPVASLAYTPYVMVATNNLPANTVPQFIAYAKSKPGEVNYGATVGAGSHIAGEVFNAMAGVRMQFIPYKGGGPVLVDLIGGQIQISFNSVNAASPQIKAGKIKALAISGDKRWPSLPDVPSFSEIGMPDYQEKAWLGLFAPRGTPKAIIDKLSAETAKAINTPSVRASLDAQGFVPLISTPEQFATMLQKESDALAPVLKAANFKLDGN